MLLIAFAAAPDDPNKQWFLGESTVIVWNAWCRVKRRTGVYLSERVVER